ncbi:MAG: HlyC/CorC family transporter [Acidobacteriota bacterium]|nr:HlyC/CorC family transporter [Acidobacteriota bacterium]
MSPLAFALIVLAAIVVVLASYMNRVYSEFGKILAHDVQDNIESWEEQVEPRIGLNRVHAALSASVLQQLALVVIALEFGAVLFDRGTHLGRPSFAEIAQAIVAVVLVVAFCCQVLPSLLFRHTSGKWARHFVWTFRFLLWSVAPISFFVRFFHSVASLADPPQEKEEESFGSVEALLEAGEEEGILEETDRELVRSAVEFGDKLVREVMTPRPRVFAVPGTTTLEKFLEMLKEHNYSRVPVFAHSLDEITGIVFAHDLLQIADEDAKKSTVASIQRAAVFVPETKRGYELLREMQREKQHMRIVIDEYGGVAGLVTIEDLLEEIVGDIRDEHETDGLADEPQHEPDGAWIVPGGFPVDQLHELFGKSVEIDDSFEATTLGGLVSEAEGRIPHAGEVVMLEKFGLRLEVLASSDRHIERLRVYPPAQDAAAS